MAIKTSLSGSRSIAQARFLPEAKSSHEGIGIVARSATWWQLFQVLDVSSSHNHVLGLQSSNEASYHVRYVLPPFLFAQSNCKSCRLNDLDIITEANQASLR